MDPDDPSLGLWTTTVVLMMTGSLVGALRDVLPTNPALIVANVLSGMGAAYMVQALRVIIGLPRGPHIQWFVGGLLFVTSTWFTVVHPSATARVFIAAAMAAAIFTYCAVILWHYQEPGLAWLGRISAIIFGLGASIHIVRMVLLPFTGVPDNFVTTPNTSIKLLYSMAIVQWATLAVILSVIISTRVQTRLRESAEAAEQANLRLLEMTWLDPGTQVANRSRIAGLLASGVDSKANFGIPLTTLLVSVENHERGGLDPRTVDMHMARIADALRTEMNLSVPDFETLGRWGDDAFLVLLSNLTQPQSAEMAQRLSRTMERMGTRDGWDDYHIGATVCRSDDTVEGLLDRLYDATYSAGTERVHFC